ncbi:hypothetical protein TNCV_4658851 [Trichonephila clavipes]|nr:hypothetical protein TNCV_4658851 [Trichonephila clavipes]
MVRRETDEKKKGNRGHRMTCVISVKRLDNCSRLLFVNLPTTPIGQLAHFPIRGLFPKPGNIISGCTVVVDGNAIETHPMTGHINTDLVGITLCRQLQKPEQV